MRLALAIGVPLAAAQESGLRLTTICEITQTSAVIESLKPTIPFTPQP